MPMITVCLKVELIAKSFNKTHVKEEVNLSEHAGNIRSLRQPPVRSIDWAGK